MATYKVLVSCGGTLNISEAVRLAMKHSDMKIEIKDATDKPTNFENCLKIINKGGETSAKKGNV